MSNRINFCLCFLALVAIVPRAANAAGPNIPKDARWTVCCAVITGPAHVEQARAVKEQLVQQTRMSDWYAVRTSDHSTLYYGYYREIDAKADAKEAARAAADRKAIAALVGGDGQRMFPSVLIVALEEADPVAPAEWDLRNARGYWSLEIAAFRDDAQRKEKAVAIVRELRKDGKEAYYFHGSTISSVCIGAFPQTAVTVDDGPRNNNPDAAIVVAPPGTEIAPGSMTEDGKMIQVQKRRIIINDPDLFKLHKEFPNHATNGVEGRTLNKDGMKVDKLDNSLLVRIPAPVARDATAGAGLPASLADQAGAVGPDSARASTLTPQPNAAVQPLPPRPVNPSKKPPQGGKLRGLDDY